MSQMWAGLSNRGNPGESSLTPLFRIWLSAWRELPCIRHSRQHDIGLFCARPEPYSSAVMTAQTDSRSRDVQTERLLTAPILPVMLSLAGPTLLVMLSQTFVGLMEVWFLSQLGEDVLAGVHRFSSSRRRYGACPIRAEGRPEPLRGNLVRDCQFSPVLPAALRGGYRQRLYGQQRWHEGHQEPLPYPGRRDQ